MSDNVTYGINFCVHLPGIEEEISVRAFLAPNCEQNYG
jgi:hypothetical protein